MSQIALTGDISHRSTTWASPRRLAAALMLIGIVVGATIGGAAIAAVAAWQNAPIVNQSNEQSVPAVDPMSVVPDFLRSERQDTAVSLANPTTVGPNVFGGATDGSAFHDAKPMIVVPNASGNDRARTPASEADPMTAVPNHLRSEREEAPTP